MLIVSIIRSHGTGAVVRVRCVIFKKAQNAHALGFFGEDLFPGLKEPCSPCRRSLRRDDDTLSGEI